MKITLIAGRAHPKHTEGQDFREASLRAVRQGLMSAESILLEPTFDFEIRLPTTLVGRAMTDINNMHGECDPPEFDGEVAILRGNAPVATIASYPEELRSYSGGGGTISLLPADYAPCHNSDEVLLKKGYNPELDEDVAGSVFCKNGAGYSVPWDEVEEKMHTENPELVRESDGNSDVYDPRTAPYRYRGTVEEDKELMRIFESTYGKIKPRTISERVENSAPEKKEKRRAKPPERSEEYLLIDGYNVIFASDELKRMASGELGFARDVLIRLIANYHGIRRGKVVLVFDAYKRRDNEGSCEEISGITVVYTKERQTADAYIEKATYGMAKDYSVKVVTSDYNEQLIVLGNGAVRISASEFLRELKSSSDEISRIAEELK